MLLFKRIILLRCGKMLIYDEKHECASQEDMRSLQLSKLKKIVEYAYENVPFYKKKYDAAGVKPGDIKTLKYF